MRQGRPRDVQVHRRFVREVRPTGFESDYPPGIPTARRQEEGSQARHCLHRQGGRLHTRRLRRHQPQHHDPPRSSLGPWQAILAIA